MSTRAIPVKDKADQVDGLRTRLHIKNKVSSVPHQYLDRWLAAFSMHYDLYRHTEFLEGHWVEILTMSLA